MVTVPIKRLQANALLPEYASATAAGADIATPKSFELRPGEKQKIDLGFAVAIPEGYEIQVRPRSGLALKTDLIICNSPGTIDSDYRGEVGVILKNTGLQHLQFKAGDRIAQMVLAPVFQADFTEVDDLEETDRGEGGFGSTGQ